MSQLAWSVDVNEFRALAGISQSGGGRNAHRGTNLPQYDHRVKRWRWTEVLVSVGLTPVQNEVLDRC